MALVYELNSIFCVSHGVPHPWQGILVNQYSLLSPFISITIFLIVISEDYKNMKYCKMWMHVSNSGWDKKKGPLTTLSFRPSCERCTEGSISHGERRGVDVIWIGSFHQDHRFHIMLRSPLIMSQSVRSGGNAKARYQRRKHTGLLGSFILLSHLWRLCQVKANLFIKRRQKQQKSFNPSVMPPLHGKLDDTEITLQHTHILHLFTYSHNWDNL